MSKKRRRTIRVKMQPKTCRELGSRWLLENVRVLSKMMESLRNFDEYGFCPNFGYQS